MNANPTGVPGSPPGTQAFGISLIANSGSLTANFNNVFTSNNSGTGIQLTESSQQLVTNMNLVRTNNNAGVGIQVQGTGGSILINGDTSPRSVIVRTTCKLVLKPHQS